MWRVCMCVCVCVFVHARGPVCMHLIAFGLFQHDNLWGSVFIHQLDGSNGGVHVQHPSSRQEWHSVTYLWRLGSCVVCMCAWCV